MPKVLAWLACVLCLGALALCTPTIPAHATTLTIEDNAQILGTDTAQIEGAAAKAPFRVVILTRNTVVSLAVLKDLVNIRASSEGENVVVIGIDNKLGYFAISDDKASLKKPDVDTALNAMLVTLKKEGWPRALVVGINSLADAAHASQAHDGVPQTSTLKTTIGWTDYAWGIGLVIVLVLVLVLLRVRIRGRYGSLPPRRPTYR